jgi:hypothetical protein
MRFYSFVEKATLKRVVEDLLRAKFWRRGRGPHAADRANANGEANVTLNHVIGLATTLAEVRKAIPKAAAAARRRHKKREAEFSERQRQPTSTE